MKTFEEYLQELEHAHTDTQTNKADVLTKTFCRPCTRTISLSYAIFNKKPVFARMNDLY